MFGNTIDRELILGEHRLEVERRGYVVVYRRYFRENLVRELVLDPSIELKVMPIYPLFYPKFITQYILCFLDRTLIVGPSSTITFYTEIPIDIAVYGYTQSAFRILDIVPLHVKPKLVLYGSQTNGLVARYCRVPVYSDKPTPMLGKAIAKLVIKNCTKSIVTVSKVLLDASPLRLYYRRGSWEAYTQQISVNLDTPNVATVTYGQPFEEGVIPIDDPPELKPPRIYNRTDMLWGYS